MIRELAFISVEETHAAPNFDAMNMELHRLLTHWRVAFPNRFVRRYFHSQRDGWVFDVELPFVLPIKGAA